MLLWFRCYPCFCVPLDCKHSASPPTDLPGITFEIASVPLRQALTDACCFQTALFESTLRELNIQPVTGAVSNKLWLRSCDLTTKYPRGFALLNKAASSFPGVGLQGMAALILLCCCWKDNRRGRKGGRKIKAADLARYAAIKDVGCNFTSSSDHLSRR